MPADSIAGKQFGSRNERSLLGEEANPGEAIQPVPSHLSESTQLSASEWKRRLTDGVLARRSRGEEMMMSGVGTKLFLRQTLARAAIVSILVVVGSALIAACGGASHPATPTATTAMVEIGAGLQGPAGLTATVIADGLANISALAADSQGRLWAATATFTDTGDDAVYLLGAAGTSPLRVITAQHTPMGLLWVDDELYVSSAGGVVAYTGFDGTRFAGQRTVLALAPGTGSPGGLALGADGRLRLGISAPCDHCTPGAKESGAVLSFLPTGADVHVEATGIRAPVGLNYDRATGDLYVTMNQRDDLGDATPGDWLAIVRSGQDWGFPDCYGQGGAACDGVPSPFAVLDKHAAVSGVAIVDGELGAAVARAAIVAEWSTGAVLRVALSDQGTSTSVTPFLEGLESPVPVLLQGSDLFVGDWATGKLYRISV